ncbi:helix-turn-helix domain-containing protein [Citrobacter freundii]|uniref:helix-turn-helix domain-containing protein n=1 Tax=Citrobacter freundii TaxID=546 RepID=UPI003CEC8E91
MNAKDKIITYLETHKPASKKELIAVTKLPVNRINQVVRDLLESGQLEIHSVTNKVNHYRLTDIHNQRVKAVLDYFEDGSSSTSGEVSDITGLDKTTVTQILISLNKQGELHREWHGKRKLWVYSKSAPFVFGCPII